jgi:hypothetical protein
MVCNLLNTDTTTLPTVRECSIAMKKPAHTLLEIVLAIKDKLSQPNDAAALHDMANALVCGLQEHAGGSSQPTAGEITASRATAMNELMLEQLGEICCTLMFNERAAADVLQTFVDAHLQRLLSEHQVAGDAARSA